VLDWMREDYLPYFYAMCAPTTRPRTNEELRQAALHGLDVAKRSEYAEIFSRPSADVFELPDLPYLPSTIGELFVAGELPLPPELAAEVASMRTQLRSEIELDLYHFGQMPNERIQHLRLGVYLATSIGWGDVYGKILSQARACIEGKEPFGQFDLVWP
jgi:hypothetical protein